MSSFDNQNLFNAGPHRFQPAGLSLRHVLHHTPDGQGVRLTAMGRNGRAIRQTGSLLADTPAEISVLRANIEAMLDGRAATLTDTYDRPWPNTVMLAFEPGPLTRVGPRWKLDYQIHYLQTAV